MPVTLLVAADTHGRDDLLREAARRAKPDMLLFLGDGLRDLGALPDDLPVRAVRGNCDWFSADDAPLTRIERVCGYLLYLTHGHAQGVKAGLDAAVAAAAAAGADVLLHGHTHVPRELHLAAGETVGGTVLQKPLLILCPGSLGQPQVGQPSFATLTLSPAGILAGFGEI